jgi:cytochrome o ubiquinol oxidase subunit 3
MAKLNANGHGVHADHHGHPDQEQLRTFAFWIYLMTDVILFACLFATYIVLEPNTNGGPSPKDIFQMNGIYLSTFILLTSSFTSGLALLAMNKGKIKELMSWLGVTVVLGLAFVILEVNEFINMVHVSIGLVWMVILIVQLAKHGITPVTKRKVNIVSLFWHFLDIVWIFVFTIVYLMGVN